MLRSKDGQDLVPINPRYRRLCHPQSLPAFVQSWKSGRPEGSSYDAFRSSTDVDKRWDSSTSVQVLSVRPRATSTAWPSAWRSVRWLCIEIAQLIALRHVGDFAWHVDSRKAEQASYVRSEQSPKVSLDLPQCRSGKHELLRSATLGSAQHVRPVADLANVKAGLTTWLKLGPRRLGRRVLRLVGTRRLCQRPTRPRRPRWSSRPATYRSTYTNGREAQAKRSADCALQKRWPDRPT